MISFFIGESRGGRCSKCACCVPFVRRRRYGRCCVRRRHRLPAGLRRRVGKVGCLFGKQEFRCEVAESDKTKRRPPFPPCKFNAECPVQGGERALLEPLPAGDLRMNLCFVFRGENSNTWPHFSTSLQHFPCHLAFGSGGGIFTFVSSKTLNVVQIPWDSCGPVWSSPVCPRSLCSHLCGTSRAPGDVGPRLGRRTCRGRVCCGCPCPRTPDHSPFRVACVSSRAQLVPELHACRGHFGLV